VAVNVPTVFLFEPAFVDIQLEEISPFRLWYVDATRLSKSSTGAVLIYFGCVIRDLLPMVSKIFVSCSSMYLVRKYVRRKQVVISAVTSTTTTAVSSHLAKFDRSQTYIALVMSAFSLLEHIVYVAAYVLYFLYYYDLSSLIYVFALLFISIKHLLIFFFLLAFNHLFRKQVQTFFKNLL
jgi:hypothetical protein